MNVEVFPADRLTPELVAAWSEIQRSEPLLDSPYFRPEFTLAVAAVRGDVEVGVLEEGGRPVGFFPFQRDKGGVGRPVGGRMSDFHGVIAPRDLSFAPGQLLAGCRLTAWHFDHLPTWQEPFLPYHWQTAGSPYLDLADGWEAYAAAQQKNRKSSFKRMLRKARQAEREVGDVRLETHTASRRIFERMIDWKRAQYRQNGVTDVLAFDWTVGLLEEVLKRQSEEFSGVLSTLTMSGTPTAIMLSMQSRHVLHAWFSAHGPTFAPFSPGLILLLELAKACPGMGVTRLDLGKGPEEYKTQFASGQIPLAEGSVDTRRVAAALRRNWHRSVEWVRNSPLRRPLLGPGRMIRRLIESKTFR